MYDTDCQALKKELEHISNQKRKEPYNEITRHNYHHLNKEYKRVLKQKNRKHQNYKMEELVNSSNPQKFWSTVKNLSTKSVNSQDLSVPVGKLYTNFVREVCLIFHGKSVVERH